LTLASLLAGPRRRRRAVVVGVLVFVLAPAAALAQTTTQVVEYYTTDAIGSVRAVTKKVNGQWQVTHHDFMPSGEQVSPPYPSPDKRLFTGKERDAETGQDYFGARYYRTDLGRFTTVDPELNIKDALVDPQRWNRYAYVRNNPLRYVDPDGKDIWDLLGGMGNAIKSNFTLGVGRQAGGNTDFRLGQFAGDLISIPVGLAETVSGGGVGLAGLAAEGPSLGTSTVVVAGGVMVMTQGGTAAVAGAAGAGAFLAKAVGDLGGGGKSVNQMNQEAKRGQAPDGVIRVDKGKVKGEQDNVHFGDGSSLNRDGTWKHGGTKLTRAQEQWLRQNGWTIPK
jgi:RHS repeat-associated protein